MIDKAPPTADARVLIIADSRNRAAQQNFASQTPGASAVEAVDLQDLIAFANGFDVGSAGALDQLLALAQSVMTNVGVPELTRRLQSLQRGTARNPPNAAENRALAFARSPSLASAAELLSELRALPTVRVHRPVILYGALKALRDASTGAVALGGNCQTGARGKQAIRAPATQARCRQHATTQRAGGRMAVVLNTEGMSAQNLYVAMTRGSMRLILCSARPLVG